MTDAFLAALESSLGVGHEKISLQEEWDQTGPETLRHRTLLDIVEVNMQQPFQDIAGHELIVATTLSQAPQLLRQQAQF